MKYPVYTPSNSGHLTFTMTTVDIPKELMSMIKQEKVIIFNDQDEYVAIIRTENTKAIIKACNILRKKYL